ncbi:WxcM-like domain-containing protein [Litorivicinus lipolyticus]|uniref:WxcM-like domain-containing protein n=1 Tax=Litorivicinus lipolyticus TaxID=418701 RepID=A0A5Q2QDC3_9GAMM|nr:WxcM-like domain-containing protein [Litorivicinus lipolyticus]
MVDFNWIEFQELGDSRGSLVSIEVGNQKQVPFEVKRLYYIYRTEEGVSRGYHAHKNLKQIAFAIHGNCDMVLDDGINRQTVRLDDPTKGILIENMVWREMHNFSSDCVLLVLASEHYDEGDYIRDYQRFIEHCAGKGK